MSYEIKPLDLSHCQQAADLLSLSMLNNPLHIAVFGNDETKRKSDLNCFFKLLLPIVLNRGLLIGAFRANKLVGVFGTMRPGACNLALMYRLNLLFKIFKNFNFLTGTKISYWLLLWHIHDLSEPHWHLGPLAVDANFQKQGIAALLLNHVFDLAKKDKYPLWLETDKEFNVDYYVRRGFKIKKTINICQTKNWLMVKS